MGGAHGHGDHVFPFQAIFLLNKPGRDFQGGELLLTESNPKKLGRADVEHCAKAMPWYSPSTTGLCAPRAASTGQICATESADCTAGSGIRLASSFTMPSELPRYRSDG